MAIRIDEFDGAFGSLHAEGAVFSRHDSDLRHVFLRSTPTHAKSACVGDPGKRNVSGRLTHKDELRARLILGHGRIDLIRPRQNPAFEIPYLAETGLLQKLHGIGGALSAAAVGYDFARTIELTRALGHIADRNEMSLQIANLVLVRLADGDDESVFAGDEPGLDVPGR